MRSESSCEEIPLDRIAPFVHAGGAGQWNELLMLADLAAQRILGHRFCTIMRYHPETMELERIHSSVPEAYPCGGRKSRCGTQWSERVLLRGEVFLGRDEHDIRANFEDHEKLIGMGLAAIINTPIKVGGRVLGTFNVMHQSGWYRAGDERVTTTLAYLIAPRLLADR